MVAGMFRIVLVFVSVTNRSSLMFMAMATYIFLGLLALKALTIHHGSSCNTLHWQDECDEPNSKDVN